LTGKPTITVGSVTLDNSTAEMMQGKGSSPTNNIAPLLASLVREQFDMVAVGRAMIANPDWPRRIRDRLPLNPYTLSMLQTLD
jgi:2,4-dienoyl-CoA reductase-like NADH-dependent reductase (Old Yellow Enzyme family)